MLRDIPALVTEVGGDPARIYAYHDSYPKNISLIHAIHTDGVAVDHGRLAGDAAGRRSAGWTCGSTRSRCSCAPRRKPTSGTAYYRLFRLITKGVPTAAGIALENATVHPSCNAMDLPTIQRQTDAEGLDYFEVPLSFTEMGDD